MKAGDVLDLLRSTEHNGFPVVVESRVGGDNDDEGDEDNAASSSFPEPFLWAFQASISKASIGMGTRRVRSAVQVSFNVAQGSVREPHRECTEEEDTPPSSSSSSWPASGELGEKRGQLTASSPFPLPSRPFVVRPERSCGRCKAARPTSIFFLFCCTCLMDRC